MKGEHSDLIDSITGMVTNKESGGLEGLVNSFKEKGLGDIMSSWISTGRNLPISDDQVQQGIGKDQIQQLAEKIGSPLTLPNQNWLNSCRISLTKSHLRGKYLKEVFWKKPLIFSKTNAKEMKERTTLIFSRNT